MNIPVRITLILGLAATFFAPTTVVAQTNTLVAEVLSPANNPTQVEQYEKLEIGVRLPAGMEQKVQDFVKTRRGINPYDPEQLDLSAKFISPSGKTKVVSGFYYEEYTRNVEKWDAKQAASHFRIRFAPDEVGTWKIQIHATFNNTTTTEVLPIGFTCIASDNPGFVTVGREGDERARYLRFSKAGKTFIALGENMTWSSFKFTAKSYDQHFKWMEELSESGGNFIRVGLVPWGFTFEWNQLGNYTQGQPKLWEMDKLLDKAHNLGIYVNLHMNIHGPFLPPRVPASKMGWPNNPYNTGLEGVTEPIHFFTDAEAIKYYQRKLRYMMARWGYSTNLAVWELFSEVDKAISEYNDVGEETEQINKWFDDIRTYIRTELGDTLRPVSVSFSTSESKNICDKVFPYADVVFNHDYGRDEEQNYKNRYKPNNMFLCKKCTENKPFIHQEIGGGYGTIDFCSDVTFHNAIWATSLSGSFGCGMNWWWDHAIHKAGYQVNFLPLSNFFEGEELSQKSYRNVKWRSSKVENFVLADREDKTRAIGWAHNRSYWWPNYYSTNDCIKKLIDDNDGKAFDRFDDTKYANWRDDDELTDYPNAKVVVPNLKPGFLFWKKTYRVTFYDTRGDGAEIVALGRDVKTDFWGRLSFRIDLTEAHPDLAYKVELVSP